MPEWGAQAVISILEFDVGQRRQLALRTLPLSTGSTISVGREADLIIGVEPPDHGVSRQALTVTRADGWRVRIQNRNGGVVQPWGQAPLWVEAQTELQRTWPRVGVRLIGSERSVEHWVLLQSPAETIPLDDRSLRRPGPTHQPGFPKPLTATQTAAVHAVFRDFLAWPPVSGAVPLPLAAAANRLGISSTALQERLSRVQDRAYALGLHQQIGVSDPGYVYLLVRHGYIKQVPP